jgi:uncharacterized protein YjbI with pentapeptide repeats
MNIRESFKKVFVSPRNSGYLFDLIITKILRYSPDYQQIIFNNIHTYKENILDLQELIFNDSFSNIYNNLSNSGNIDLEQVLIELNKITVSKFEIILQQDLNNKYNQQAQVQQAQVQQAQVQQAQVQQVQVQQAQVQQAQVQQAQVQQAQVQQAQVQQAQVQQGNSIIEEDNFYNILSRQFFSENAVFNNGKYSFQFFLNKVKSVNLDNFKIKCNMYNINEYNNKFYLLEQTSKTIIIIPIGYYDIDTLLKTITNLLNDMSINKNKDYSFNVFNNKIKNRVCFTCESNDKQRLNKNTSFGLLFKKESNNYSLSDILGFEKEEYFNNNVYTAELYPNINIFDELYVKIFINDKEIPRYSTSKRDFYYFETFDLDIRSRFGDKITFDLPINSFEITQDNLDIKDISIQLNNSYDYYINNPVSFKFMLTFEYG